MHVLAISEVTDTDGFWNALKRAHGRLPKGSKWTLAVAGTDGACAVNIIEGEGVERVRGWFDEYTAAFATTRFTEADAANAVGLA